jgi:hypothetical protein
MAAPSFLRLWAIGGCANSMRSFEVLAAALFTLDVTGSGLAVAIVTAARTMPMFLLGAFSGVMSEAVNRKHVLVAGQIVTACASATVAVLGCLGLARPWHVAATALVAGTVWSTEMATRRRMVGECVEGALVPRALALDTVTNSVTRMVGPVVAGAMYQLAGLAGAFAVSAAVFLCAAVLSAGLHYRQATRPIVLAQVPRELAEGLAFARGHVVIAGVLLVTMTMNLLGFSYSALLAPIGRQHFMVSPTLVGVLAAAEAFGALLGGLRLASGDPPGIVHGVRRVDATVTKLRSRLRAADNRRDRLGGILQHADLAARYARAAPCALAPDGAADRVYRHGTIGHPADRRYRRPGWPTHCRRYDGVERVGCGRQCRTAVAAKRTRRRAGAASGIIA